MAAMVTVHILYLHIYIYCVLGRFKENKLVKGGKNLIYKPFGYSTFLRQLSITFNKWVPHPLILTLDFVVISRQCLPKNRRELAEHFNHIQQDLSHIKVIVMERIIINTTNHKHLEHLLFTREVYWMTQLFALQPHGLNKKQEFRSKKCICCNN